MIILPEWADDTALSQPGVAPVAGAESPGSVMIIFTVFSRAGIVKKR
jgi:hypothetical protein